MNIIDLQKLVYDFILSIIKYFTDLCCKKKDIVDAKEEIKEEIQLEQQDEIDYDNSFNNNDKQIVIEEIAEEVIERIMEQYILLKKQN